MAQGLKYSNVALWVGTVLVAGLLLTAWATHRHAQNNLDEAQRAVAAAAEGITGDVTTSMQLYQYGLRGARGAILTAGEQGINRELFQQYSRSRDINTEFPGARGFGFIRRVAPDGEAAFLKSARTGWPTFNIYQLEEHGGERYVIEYIEPVDRNEASIGLDIASEVTRRTAAQIAMREGTATLTGPITLVQESGERQQSFLLLMPIYRGGGVPATQTERETAVFGWSFAPLSMREVLAHIQINTDALHMRLHDITAPDRSEMFYETPRASLATAELFTQRIERDVFGRRWQIEISAYPAFINGLNQFQPRSVALGGLAATLLAAALAAALNVSRQREAQIATEQARLATIVENSSDAIIGEALDGSIISWNRAAAELFGYSEAEVLGQPLAKLLIPVDRRHEDENLLARTARGEAIAPFDTLRLARDGTRIDMAITAAAIREPDGRIVGVAKLMHDIRDRKAEQQRLTDFNTRLERQVAERTTELHHVNVLLGDVLRAASEVSIISTDVKGIITIFNAGAERMLGYTAEEMVGKNTPAIMHRAEEIAARGAELSAEYRMPIVGFRVFVHKPEIDGAETREWTYVRKDGTTLQVSLVATAMRDAHGRITGYLGIAEDVTERRRATEALREAKVAAEAANRAKGQFLTMMSHELRTPMAGILGMTDLLLTTDLRAEQRALLQTQMRSAHTLLDLLNDILDFAKIEAGRVDLEDIDFSVAQIVLDIAAVMRPLASEKGNNLEVEIDPSVEAAYRGDAKRYRQILMNLAGNANKFTTKGKIAISVRATAADNGRFAIETLVSDNGIGIAAANREHLFQPFIQEDISTSRKFGGTSLGLAISKNLAELMGGRIWVDSERGKGSTFGFVVMLNAGDAARTEALGSPARRTPASIDQLPVPRKPLRVLLAEDNDTNRMLLTALMSRMGHSLIAVEHGGLAVEEAARGGYDLILMDMQMPIVDGPTAMRRIRAQEQGARLPIIALTADAMREHHASYLDAGADAVVTKPVDWHRLSAEMERLTTAAASGLVPSANAVTVSERTDEHPVLDTGFLDTLAASVEAQLFATLLDSFTVNVASYSAAVTAAAATRNLIDAKRTAHALKGLAAQFGAMKLSELARLIEETAKGDQDVEALAVPIAAAAEEAVRALDGWRTAQRKSA